MKQHLGHRFSFKKFLRDERGAVLVIATVYLPVIVGFFTLAVDMSYVYRTRNALQVTAEAAALAATSQLPDPAISCSIAKTYATANMPVASYGNVLKQNTADCSDVVLGTWLPANNCADATTGTNLFCALSGGQDCIAFKCNAAKVTTRMEAANSNALQLAFASMIGIPTFDVAATAIAVFGSNSQPWDMAIVQDVSISFAMPNYPNPANQGALPQAKAADLGLLGCLDANAPPGSRLGITMVTGTTQVYQSPTAVNGNTGTLQTAINSIKQCSLNPTTPPTPLCSSGTDIAAGINTTVTEYTNVPNPAGSSQRSMVIVTDGLPSSVNNNYCNNVSSCVNTAKQNAEDAADAAALLGINIYTIYYCSGNSCDASAQTWLGNLKRGSGLALVTPDPTKLSTLMGNICASQPHRLVW